MEKNILTFLDIFFLAFHSVFIVFNILGWLWKKTRKLHLITVVLTAFSWFILGIWYGWGYCFCTDWHWQVRELLDKPGASGSYIHFLILELTGIDFPPHIVNWVVLSVFCSCLVLSVIFNVRDARKKRKLSLVLKQECWNDEMME